MLLVNKNVRVIPPVFGTYETVINYKFEHILCHVSFHWKYTEIILQ
jgi:hypothetical protein